MPETFKPLKPKRSKIISTVLSPALRLWLRSQVEDVERLQFKISSGDRQILTGHIPCVSVAASGVVYQGLHLSKIQLEGTNIRVNFGQVIKGMPLRLLEPVPVVGQLQLLQSDLQASLQAPLLAKALTDLLGTILLSNGIANLAPDLNEQQISWQQITIEAAKLTLIGTLTSTSAQPTQVVIHAGLQLLTPNELRLDPLQIQILPTLPLRNLDYLHLDLGSEVDIQELSLTSGELMCSGRLNVIP